MLELDNLSRRCLLSVDVQHLDLGRLCCILSHILLTPPASPSDCEVLREIMRCLEKILRLDGWGAWRGSGLHSADFLDLLQKSLDRILFPLLKLPTHPLQLPILSLTLAFLLIYPADVILSVTFLDALQSRALFLFSSLNVTQEDFQQRILCLRCILHACCTENLIR